jgi:2-polyprenyl-3-methyl-5-hydroxy-6-metoxy-1,4-benzoquinol methylase
MDTLDTMDGIESDLKAEAAAFNNRMTERKNAGFIPDLRRAVRCEHFYKSMWRDPYFVDLYAGHVIRTMLGMLGRHVRPGARILDLGCGGGHYTLELARAGYNVVGIDIADKAIATARETLASNPYKQGFGSLSYQVGTLDDVQGEFDAVFIIGVLHHLHDLPDVLKSIRRLLRKDGMLVALECCHERWRPADAAQVALIRGLLGLTGHWYDGEEVANGTKDRQGFDAWTSDVHAEYFNERDKNEPDGQSPNDNAADGAAVLEAVAEQFDILENVGGAAYSYRLLGGLRGDDAQVKRIADFLATYEREAVEKGHIQPNQFIFAARKRA